MFRSNQTCETANENMSIPNTKSNNGDFYIDVHAHVFPGFYKAAMKEVGIKDIDGWQDPEWSVEAMLKAADEHKIAAQVLSLSSPGITFVNGKAAADLARRLNEYMAGLVKEHSPQFGSMAVLPLPDVEASLGEIAYGLDTLGMDGVCLLSNYHGVYLGDPKFEPVFAELNRRKAMVFVHPTIPPHWDTFAIGLAAPVMEYTFDSSRMAMNLVNGGQKVKYPDVGIIVAHAGGTLPFNYQRVVKYWMNGKNDVFNTFFYELTATTEPEQIRALMALAKPDQCMMGFDFPFMKPAWYDPLQKSLEAYGFPPGVLRSVQNGNAARLFPKVAERLRQTGNFISLSDDPKKT